LKTVHHPNELNPMIIQDPFVDATPGFV